MKRIVVILSVLLGLLAAHARTFQVIDPTAWAAFDGGLSRRSIAANPISSMAVAGLIVTASTSF